MKDFEYSEALRETLQELREDAMLIGLALLGTQGAVDKLTRDCLLRLADYLNRMSMISLHFAESICDCHIHYIIAVITCSATFRPSTAALVMPPAYPAPSPQG